MSAAAQAGLGPGRAAPSRNGQPREARPVHVCKFGSSVLACPDDYLVVADAIGAEVAQGRKIVAVVSAMGGTTDSLLSAARSVAPAAPDGHMGALLATGEEASVALLVLALAARGTSAVGYNAWRAPLRTRGALDDAEPVAVDAETLRDGLAQHDVAVFPGFVGVDATGVPSLLGRGGSDLTALFLGHALGADEVRLVKDVDGIYPCDPRGVDGAEAGEGSVPGAVGAGAAPGGSLAPIPEMTWAQAREIGGGVVQEKAINFAERLGLRFRVAALHGAGAGTVVREDAGSGTGPAARKGAEALTGPAARDGAGRAGVAARAGAGPVGRRAGS